VGASPEHDPGELEEVEKDKVRPYSGSLCDEGCVVGEQVPDIANLKKEQGDPVDANKDVTGGEWSVIVHSKEGMIRVVVSIGWTTRGVHDGENQVEKEAENCSNLVSCDIALGTFTVLRERIANSHFESISRKRDCSVNLISQLSDVM